MTEHEITVWQAMGPGVGDAHRKARRWRMWRTIGSAIGTLLALAMAGVTLVILMALAEASNGY